MYEAAYGSLPPGPELSLARLRITRVLTRHDVCSMRTLESKISESGRGPKPAPHVLYYAIKTMENDGTLRTLRPAAAPCQFYTLATVDPAVLDARLSFLVAEATKWNTAVSRSDTVGKHGESIVHQAFVSSPAFYVGPGWGNVEEVNGITIPSSRTGRKGSVDGFIMLSALPPSEGAAIVEVKNIREWIYPMELMLWDVIRNGFVVNAVPVILTRKIYHSTYNYVLSQLGAVGIQLHNQFLPTAMQNDLASCKDKSSLGFKDITFTATPPNHVREAVKVLANQLPNSRARMTVVRATVLPFLDDLANEATPRKVRKSRYVELQTALKAIR